MSVTFGQATLGSSEEAIAHATASLATMYNDPMRAVIREYLANAVDAIHEAEKIDPNNPKTVTISIQETEENTVLSFSDTGLGMTHEQVDNLILTYGNSTKRTNTGQIGRYGYGAKSGLSIGTMIGVHSVHDGVASQGSLTMQKALHPTDIARVNKLLLEPQDTQEPNGTTITIQGIPDTYPYNMSKTKYSTHVMERNTTKTLMQLAQDLSLFIDPTITIKLRINDDEHDVARPQPVFTQGPVNIYDACHIESKVTDWNYYSIIINGVSYPQSLEAYRKSDKLFTLFATCLQAKNYITIDLNKNDVHLPMSRESVTINQDTTEKIDTLIKDTLTKYMRSIVDKIDENKELDSSEARYIKRFVLSNVTLNMGIFSKNFSQLTSVYLDNEEQNSISDNGKKFIKSIFTDPTFRGAIHQIKNKARPYDSERTKRTMELINEIYPCAEQVKDPITAISVESYGSKTTHTIVTEQLKNITDTNTEDDVSVLFYTENDYCVGIDSLDDIQKIIDSGINLSTYLKKNSQSSWAFVVQPEKAHIEEYVTPLDVFLEEAKEAHEIYLEEQREKRAANKAKAKITERNDTKSGTVAEIDKQQIFIKFYPRSLTTEQQDECEEILFGSYYEPEYFNYSMYTDMTTTTISDIVEVYTKLVEYGHEPNLIFQSYGYKNETDNNGLILYKHDQNEPGIIVLAQKKHAKRLKRAIAQQLNGKTVHIENYSSDLCSGAYYFDYKNIVIDEDPRENITYTHNGEKYNVVEDITYIRTVFNIEQSPSKCHIVYHVLKSISHHESYLNIILCAIAKQKEKQGEVNAFSENLEKAVETYKRLCTYYAKGTIISNITYAKRSYDDVSDAPLWEQQQEQQDAARFLKYMNGTDNLYTIPRNESLYLTLVDACGVTPDIARDAILDAN